MQEQFIPKEELIKSGDLAGREALEYLSDTGEFVFHGSPFQIEELEPRQAFNHGQPDGEPAVAATTNIDKAILRAMVHRLRDEQDGRRHNSGWAGTEAGMVYYSLADSIDALSDEDIGYVYALSIAKNRFMPIRSEMRAVQPVKPDFSVIVHKEDLPEIKTFSTLEELQEFQKELRR